MVWLSGKAACQQCVYIHVCFCVYVCVCLPMCLVLLKCGFFFPPLMSLLRTHLYVWVAATISRQASNLVGFGIISGHKFINTVGIWG